MIVEQKIRHNEESDERQARHDERDEIHSASLDDDTHVHQAMADDRVTDQSKEQKREERAIFGQHSCSEKVRYCEIGNRRKSDWNYEGEHQIAKLNLNEAGCCAVFSRQQVDTIAKTANKSDSKQRIQWAVSYGPRSVSIRRRRRKDPGRERQPGHCQN